MKMTESTTAVEETKVPEKVDKPKSELEELEIVTFLKNIDWDNIARRIRNGVNLVGKALVYIAEQLMKLGKYLSEV